MGNGGENGQRAQEGRTMKRSHKKLAWKKFSDNSCAWLSVGKYDIEIYPYDALLDTCRKKLPWRGPFRFEIFEHNSRGDITGRWLGKFTCQTAKQARDAAWDLFRRVVEVER